MYARALVDRSHDFEGVRTVRSFESVYVYLGGSALHPADFWTQNTIGFPLHNPLEERSLLLVRPGIVE